MVYPIIYKFSTIQGGAGFLPPTISPRNYRFMTLITIVFMGFINQLSYLDNYGFTMLITIAYYDIP